nr:EOG090X087A [Lepidurus arcticus]
MNLFMLIVDCNPGRVLVYTSLLLFSLFLALNLDGVLHWDYWTIFAPLWAWKMSNIFATIMGMYFWWKFSRSRQFKLDAEAYVHNKAMFLSLVSHILLCVFEVLICDKLTSNRLLWVLTFAPFFLLSVISVPICIWAVRHKRCCEIELVCAVNILQALFLALKLDNLITWRWEVVFIPTWITLCIALVGFIYAIVLAAVLLRTREITNLQKRSSVSTVLVYSFTVVPAVIFQVLLTNKLDDNLELSYVAVCLPLYISLATQILRSFTSRGGNPWWCGMRKEFSVFLLEAFPSLTLYGNISCHRPVVCEPERSALPVSTGQANTEPRVKKSSIGGNKLEVKTVVPALIIDAPD